MRLILVLTIIFCTIIFAFIAFKTAYPFMIGLMVALLINPFVNYLQENIGISRLLSIFIVLTCFLAIAVGSITIIISEIIIGTNYLAQSVPLHFQTLIYAFYELFTKKVLPLYEQITALFYSLEADQQETILTYLDTITAQISSNVSTTIQALLTSISEFLLLLPNLASVIIFSLLATFFISKDWYKLVFIYRKWIPNGVVERTKVVVSSLKKAFIGFVFAQLTLVSMTCCIVLIGLILMKVEYPITIALISAIVDLFPYIGTGLIFIPWIFYSFLTGQMTMTISLAILYGIIIIQRQIMEPKILSTSIGVDPLATMVSLFVGYQLFGFLGLILGPVILVFIQTLHNVNVFRDLVNYIRKT